MIDSKTSLYCVLGNPVLQSLSPPMHNAFFSHFNIPAVYLAFKVSDIQSAISAIKTLGIKGASITIPHKRSVMAYLDEIDETALAIGAVNTIINKDGKLKGTNTDWLGAIHSIEEITLISGKRIGLIGSGGSARAILYGLIKRGADVSIYNRTEKNGEALGKEMNIRTYPLSAFGDSPCDIVINTTPLGMTPLIGDSPIREEAITASMLVMDIVYRPPKTALIQIAENKGCRTIGGLSMFIRQGALQFELWTNHPPPESLIQEMIFQYAKID